MKKKREKIRSRWSRVCFGVVEHGSRLNLLLVVTCVYYVILVVHVHTTTLPVHSGKLACDSELLPIFHMHRSLSLAPDSSSNFYVQTAVIR